MSIGCVAVFRLISPIDTGAESTTKTRIRASRRCGRNAASFLVLLASRPRDRLSVSTGNRMHEEKFRTCRFENLVYLGNLGF